MCAVALHSPKFGHRQYICICASHVFVSLPFKAQGVRPNKYILHMHKCYKKVKFVGLPILVRRPAVHASARFNQRLSERLAIHSHFRPSESETRVL